MIIVGSLELSTDGRVPDCDSNVVPVVVSVIVTLMLPQRDYENSAGVQVIVGKSIWVASIVLASISRVVSVERVTLVGSTHLFVKTMARSTTYK